MVINVERGAAIINYHVFVGPYILTLRMLNINDNLTFDKNTSIGTGVSGFIIPLTDGQDHFVAKLVSFNEEIQLMEFNTEGIDWRVSACYSKVKLFLI
jgi:hypothetical protein